ncbi:putative ABC-type sugar transport system,periplasmic component [Vibrio nigripulchritudo MADA3029]|uniref:Autoinducer 2-binding periplasmic protein LuxP n=2 Tax=Vibrio nigripulchritudo TaxID=28173 RepID=U4JYE4_9VIBR|nr:MULTISPECIES: substrate-binding domain-containing protein [Vibrio]KJY80773.1 sugar ABC transporter substrate-binding protein [Vibrio nigripulchritudo]UAB68934.1 substrate-binding domain-containing protein [Vibrio sp. SCSIO 43132]CCN46157.1 putative ABC-type sugar transport system,periplasmic component [Vibrio nigripulchritudo MADA3020]CCN51129.1 putative ABC-type sugar transport system,periplasmic component [Vibrio nigripulchritudo MADA3021]CCN56897.1 putative ABC-type sugar transport syste
MTKIIRRAVSLFAIAFSSSSFADGAEGDFLAYAQEKVAKAIASNQIWDGPTDGPRITRDKNIIFIASDLRNGGVYGVARGMSEAISNLDWHLRFIDGLGSKVRQGAALRKAIGFEPDAIVLGGIDAQRHRETLKLAESLGIVVIGWHATELAGGNKDLGLYMNITTDPLDVAEVAALLAVVDSKGTAKAVVFNDPNYQIATIKANKMAQTIERCPTCTMLEIQPLPLDEIAEKMPDTFEYLWKKHDEQITHILAINDLYIDYAIPSLESNLEKGKPVPSNISAGDGSKAAYKRIDQDFFQLATVPEPLYLQGWQIIDELNRAFHQLPPSGYSAPVHLVTPENVEELINQDDTGIYDPENGYRDAYLKIWKGR